MKAGNFDCRQTSLRFIRIARTASARFLPGCAESRQAAVRATALGLIQRDRKVIVVVDAVGTHDNHEARMALRKVQAKGARLIETRRLAGISHLRKVGACHCESCRRLAQKLPAGSPTDN